MKKLIALLFLLPVLVMGQKGGVKFEREITAKKWTEIFEKAKKEGKYVFVYMCFSLNKEQNNSFFNTYQKPIFEDTAVIGFLNSKFINVFVENDYSKNVDSKTNAVAEQLRSRFKIRIYPTFLFFDEEGNPVHRFCNTNFPQSILLEQAKLAFDKDLRYYSLIKKFEEGNRTTTFLKQLFNVLKIAKDSTDKYVLEFIKSRDNLFTKENAEIMMQSQSHYIALDYLFNNQDIWKNFFDESLLDKFYKDDIERQVSETYFDRYYFNIKADDLIKTFDEKYPKYGREASVRFLLRQLKNDKKYTELAQTIIIYLDSSLISTSNAYELNDYAWSSFLYINDTILLNKALSWSKKSLELYKYNPAYLDTYANILYKLGQTKEAIEIETKAVELVDVKDKKSYEETLDKMKKGKPTWR